MTSVKRISPDNRNFSMKEQETYNLRSSWCLRFLAGNSLYNSSNLSTATRSPVGFAAEHHKYGRSGPFQFILRIRLVVQRRNKCCSYRYKRNRYASFILNATHNYYTKYVTVIERKKKVSKRKASNVEIKIRHLDIYQNNYTHDLCDIFSKFR